MDERETRKDSTETERTDLLAGAWSGEKPDESQDEKIVGLAVVLALLFDPLGLIYASVHVGCLM